jgi:hypothetical protein
MKMTKQVKALVAQYAAAHREIRTLKYNDYNLDVTVAYACADLLNLVKRNGNSLELLKDEVAYEQECLAKIRAQQ